MATTATAAVALSVEAPYTLEEVTLDELRPNEVLVDMVAVGICHTDSTLRPMYPHPVVLGHEGTGVVERVGSDVTYVQPGDTVVMSYPYCGDCGHCQGHRQNMCENFQLLAMSGARPDGSATIYLNDQPITSAFFAQSSFATKAVTTESNLARIADPGPAPQQLAALPCGIVTGAGSMLNVVDIQKDQSLAVFGAGAVGLSAVMAAASVGASPIIVIDVVEERLTLAKELGATHTVNGKDSDVVEQIRAIAPLGQEVTLETAGHLTTFNNAVASAKKGSTIALVTLPNIGGTFELDGMALLSQGLTLIAVQMGDSITREFIPQLLKLNEEGKFPYEKLISYYDFADINTAFEDSHSGKAIKPVLLMPKSG